MLAAGGRQTPTLTRVTEPEDPAGPGRVDHRTFFFLHVMKTAGTSFAQHVRANFGPDEIYPVPTEPHELQEAQYWLIAKLYDLTPAQRASIRMYHGHLPYLVSEVIDADVTLTLLRDPVERVVSHIRHCRRHHPRGQGRRIDEVYEDPWLHPLFFRNYQVKQFALTVEDRPKAHNEDVVIRSGRLALALDNLERVDLFGLTDRYDEFLDEVIARYGWQRAADRRLQSSDGEMRVSRALLARIAEDSAEDVEFYERAKDLYWERVGRRARPAERA